MIDALVTGKLAAAPQARTTKAGKPMATARLRVPTTDPAVTIFCSVAAFDPEAVAALLALNAGDAVSVGRLPGQAGQGRRRGAAAQGGLNARRTPAAPGKSNGPCGWLYFTRLLFFSVSPVSLSHPSISPMETPCFW